MPRDLERQVRVRNTNWMSWRPSVSQVLRGYQYLQQSRRAYNSPHTQAVRYAMGAQQAIGLGKRVYAGYGSRGTKKRALMGKAKIWVDGAVGNQRRSKVKGRKKKRKISRMVKLEKRVRLLNKLKTPDSKYTSTIQEFIKLRSSGDNESAMYEIPAFEFGVFEDAMSAIEYPSGNVDLPAKDVSVKIKDIHASFKARNAKTGVVSLKWAWYLCRDDSSGTCLSRIQQEWADRGLGAWTIRAKVDTSITAATLPSKIHTIGTVNRLNNVFFSAPTLLRYWKQIGKVQSIRLNPGDEVNMRQSMKDMLYLPERQDNAGVAHIRGYTLHLVIKVDGLMGHLAGAFESAVGYSSHGLDCNLITTQTLSVDNGLGLKKNLQSFPTNTVTMLATVDAPVHAEKEAGEVTLVAGS